MLVVLLLEERHLVAQVGVDNPFGLKRYGKLAIIHRLDARRDFILPRHKALLSYDFLAGLVLHKLKSFLGRGELFHTIVARQFRVLRDGDRFWYQRSLSQDELREIEETSLADIIRRNTDVGSEISVNAFIIE